MDEAVELVIKFGGVASGEHGDGQARGQFLPQMFGPELFEAFKEFKRIWDPRQSDESRQGGESRGPRLRHNRESASWPGLQSAAAARPTFRYSSDKHNFARAALRCVGVGVCRREKGGTMCPSYMVTREEKDSTRGRARMLFEMLNGEVVRTAGKARKSKMRSIYVSPARAVKAIARSTSIWRLIRRNSSRIITKGGLRPRHAYAFGWIHIWARIASFAPSLANLFTQLPGLSRIAKFIAGAHPRRRIPPFAPFTFKQWYRCRANGKLFRPASRVIRRHFQ